MLRKDDDGGGGISTVNLYVEARDSGRVEKGRGVGEVGLESAVLAKIRESSRVADEVRWKMWAVRRKTC